MGRLVTSTRAAAARLLLLAASLLVAFLIGEAVVALFAPQQLTPMMGADWNGLGTLRANFRGRHIVPGEFDLVYTTDARGFRRTAPGGRAPRILCIGDSFTFGIGAADDATYPATLARELRADVINAGVPGTGTGEQALLYANRLFALAPDVVILGYHNDGVDDSERQLFHHLPDGTIAPHTLDEIAAASRGVHRVQRVANELPGYRFLAEHSQLFNLARFSVTKILRRRRAQRLTGSAAPNSGDAEAILDAELDLLVRQTRAHGARLVVAYLPDITQVYGAAPDDNERERTMLLRVCSARGITGVDTTPLLRRAAAAGSPPLFYTGIDKHPTPAGYRVIAAAIAGAVKAAR